MTKPVYCVMAAALYEHASLELATSDFGEATSFFEDLVAEDGWRTVTLVEWFEGKETTLEINYAW